MMEGAVTVVGGDIGVAAGLGVGVCVGVVVVKVSLVECCGTCTRTGADDGVDDDDDDVDPNPTNRAILVNCLIGKFPVKASGSISNPISEFSSESVSLL